MHAETVKVLAQPDVRARLEGLGLQLVGNTPEQFAEIIRADAKKYGELVRRTGATAD